MMGRRGRLGGRGDASDRRDRLGIDRPFGAFRAIGYFRPQCLLLDMGRRAREYGNRRPGGRHFGLRLGRLFDGGLGGAGIGDRRRRARGHGLGFRIDTSGDHRNPDASLQCLIEGGAEDDIGVVVDFFANTVGGFVHFEQGDVLAGGDIDQHALGALHGGIVEQGIGDRRLGGFDGAVVAFGLAGAHHGLAHLAHHRLDVGEIQIDEAR